MKRLNFLLLASFFAFSVCFISCSDDETDNPSITVTARWDGNQRLIVSDDEITGDQGVWVTFDVVYEMGKNKLKSVQLFSEVVGKSKVTALDSAFAEGLFGGSKEFKFQYQTNIGKENEVLTITGTDSKDRITSISITIKVEEEEVVIPPGEDYVYVVSPVTQLGGQAHLTLGSFYSFGMGKVYTIRAAKESSSDVDFAYWVGPTMYSPARAANEGLKYSSNADLNPDKWTRRNATKFAEVSILNASPDPNNWYPEWWEDATKDLVNGYDKIDLSVNSIIAFKTVNGEQGAFIVTAIGSGTAGTISIKIIERKEK